MRADEIIDAIGPFADAARAALKATNAALKRLNPNPRENAETSRASLRSIQAITKQLHELTEPLQAIRAPMTDEEMRADKAAAAREFGAMQKRLQTNLKIPFRMEFVDAPRRVTVLLGSKPDELTTRYLNKLAKEQTIGVMKVLIDKRLERKPPP